MDTPLTPLAPLQVRRSMALSVAEGRLFALMVGFGEIYFLADAIRLGATPLQMGLVVALPLFAGSLGPILSLRILGRLRTRKPVVVGAVLGQALTLAVMSLGDAGRSTTAGTLIAAACLYQFFGQAAGAAWSSWYGDLVPVEVRGHYFSRRTRAVHFTSCVGMLAAGVLLDRLEPGAAHHWLADSGRGFVWVFGLAAGFRAASAVLLCLSPEPRFQGLSGWGSVGRFLRTARGTATSRMLLAVAVLQFAVYFGSPYFGPYMLEELRFSYLEYTVATLSAVALKVATLGRWGRWVDRVGARSTCSLAVVLLALVPVPWLWAQGLGWVVVAQAFSGLSWAAYELSWFALLLESSFKRTRVHVFAAQSLLNGSAQLLGGLAGALFVAFGPADLRWVFASSAAMRVVAALRFHSVLPARSDPRSLGRSALLLRVVGWRPGGLAHRPMPVEAGSDADGGTPSKGALDPE